MGASLSKQIPWLQMNRLSFTLKSYAELLAFMSAVHAQALPEAGNLNPACMICTVCEQPAVDGQSVAAITNKKPSLLRLPMQ